MSKRRLSEAWDVVVAADPGATRLFLGLDAGLAISVVLAVVYGFVELAHPFWVSTASGGSAAAAQNDAVTVILLLLCGIFALFATIGMHDARPIPQAISLLGAPVGMLGAMAGAIAISAHHWIGIACLTAVVGIGTWIQRFGPRFTLWGTLGFMGFFFGLLAGPELPLAEFYWLAAVLFLAAGAALALRLVLLNRLAGGAVERGRASFAARTRQALDAAADLIASSEAEDRRHRRRTVERRLLRLNESALMLDGQLADPRSRISADAAQHLHEQLFELELAVGNLGRFAASLADAALPDELRRRIAGWLLAARAGDPDPAGPDAGATPDDPAVARLPELARDELYVVHALVSEVGGELADLGAPAPPGSASTGAGLLTDVYQSSVSLAGGFLVGSTIAGRRATASGDGSGRGLASRLGLDAATQSAIRVMVAVGAASALGSLADERRFYWAAISGFVAFRGTATAGEQVSRAGARTLGTFVGILVGSLIAGAIGPSPWSLAIIVPVMTVSIYLQRVSYTAMATGITIVIAVIYVQLGESSFGVLASRLELTAIGSVAAMLAALLVLPVRTLRVTRQATVDYLAKLHDLLAALAEALGAPHPASELTGRSRAMDDALMQTLASARPLAHEPFRHRSLSHNLVLLTSAAHLARNLSATVPLLDGVDGGYRAQVGDAVRREAAAVAALGGAMRTRSRMAPRRALVEPLAETGHRLGESGVAWSDPRRRMLRQLLALDGTLARLGRNLGGAEGDDAGDDAVDDGFPPVAAAGPARG